MADQQQHQHQQFLGDASTALPSFGHIEINETLPPGVTPELVRTFEFMYQEHCEVRQLVNNYENLEIYFLRAATIES